MPPELKVGDIVDITITGARVTDLDPPYNKKHGRAVQVAISGKNREEAKGAVWTELDAITIQIVETAPPAEWPPQVGDLWRDRDGDLWFGVDVRDYDDPSTPVVELVHAHGGPSRNPAEVNREFGPFTLVRREQTENHDPAEVAWPPQPGDLWRDRDGDVWTAVDTTNGVRLRMYEGSSPNTVRFVRDSYGPLELVRREYEDQ
ncbi:hypothetical protein ACFSKW_54830 [Nonomuraea mangrovi]|uniref:Uncharacterized protein n=1 Tax=Nonomuraea mangrovi TaxID=2316207 RepID=A0ABW4TET6_9ACTN